MHGESDFVSQVVFGWDPLWLSSILFAATYVAIVLDKVNRAIVAGREPGRTDVAVPEDAC